MQADQRWLRHAGNVAHGGIGRCFGYRTSGTVAKTPTYPAMRLFLARDVYISPLGYDVNVRLSVRLSVCDGYALAH